MRERRGILTGGAIACAGVIPNLIALVLLFLAGTAAASDSPMLPVPSRILWVGLNIEDLGRSLKFCTDVIGLKEQRRYAFPGLTEVLLNFPDAARETASLVLVYRADHKGPYELGTGINRFGIQTVDMNAILERIAQAGPKLDREPMEAGAKLAFLKDPDGYVIELIQMI